MQEEVFHQAKGRIIGRERTREGIGTLSEKTVHAVLKNYIEPNPENQEIPLCGYVADIVNGFGVIEIQTRSFERMRKKLEAFLAEMPVTVVYPISQTTWITSMDVETGEISGRRKSPKKGRIYDIFSELYKIRPLLSSENLRFHLVLMETEEYRTQAADQRRAKRGRMDKLDKVPLHILEEISIERREDYRMFLPESLPEVFLSSDLAKAAKITRELASVTLLILTDLQIVERVGKRGHSYEYRLKMDDGRRE